MRILFIAAVVLATLATGLAIADAPTKPETPKYDSITLVPGNFVTLIGEVENGVIDNLIINIEKAKTENVYIYIDSPGGDVFAGVKLIEYFGTTKKNITCVAKQAISMAHQIMQACPVRIGTPHNMMMQHRMSTTIRGPVQQMQGLLASLASLERKLNIMSANRIGVSIDYFYLKVTQDWWTFGPESKQLNMVDEIKLVRCAPELYLIETKTVQNQSGQNFNIIQNGCPLVDIREDTSVNAKK